MNMICHLLAAAPTTQDTPPLWFNPQFVIFGVIILIFFMMTGSGKKRRAEDKKRKESLGKIKRGDRVETIGGILASVVEVRDTEVVLKVDESTNTKIRIARDAIKRVTEEGDSSAQQK